jgi:hypothetical protein
MIFLKINRDKVWTTTVLIEKSSFLKGNSMFLNTYACSFLFKRILALRTLAGSMLRRLAISLVERLR